MTLSRNLLFLFVVIIFILAILYFIIGKTNSNIINNKVSSPTIPHNLSNVINLIDQLTIHGTLKLIEHASGLICSESSILHYGTIIELPMLVVVPDKNIKHYGLIDINDRHQGYFKSFGFANVVVTDFNDFTLNHLTQFVTYIEQQP